MRKIYKNIISSMIILLPFIFSTKAEGLYIPVLQIKICNTVETCLHEEGHFLDDSLGWVSQSEEYKNTVQTFIRVSWMTNPEDRTFWQNYISWFPGISIPKTDSGWGGYSELYAQMYQDSKGNIFLLPLEFQKFYK